MKWLITGGCGFIGTNLIQWLQRQGTHHIRIVDNLSSGTRSNLTRISSCIEKNPIAIDAPPEGLELVVGDILDEELAHRVVLGVDAIVHLAANTGVTPSVEEPRSDCYANIIGTLNYLEAARQRKIQRVVFASSGAPIGNVTPPIHEELPPHPVSPYGASKLAGEGYCSAYYHSFGLNTIALRFGNVYGPGSHHKDSVVAKFIRQALDGEVLEIYGDGTQTRDFIYIDDLVEAIYLAGTGTGMGGEIFQIASNRETTVGEVTEHIVKSLEAKGITNVRVMNAERRVGDVMRNYSDTTKARKVLGWHPRTSLQLGLEKTVDFFLRGA